MDLFLSSILAPKPRFDTSREIPPLSGKIILITGGTSGLGRETVLSFVNHGPAHIYFTGRSQSAADQLLQTVSSTHPSVPVTFIQCDLASLASVRSAAQTFLSQASRLDILMANAGVLGPPPGLTDDGYEIQFGTNHVGHALLARLLTSVLTSTSQQHGDARIIWTTSLAYRTAPSAGIIFTRLRTPQTDISKVAGEWFRYGQSKLANLLYARAFARQHPEILSISIHPGVSATSIMKDLTPAGKALVYVTNVGKMLTPEQCSWNQQWAATAKIGDGEREVRSGIYYEPVGFKGKLGGKGGDDKLADELWKWTQKELDGYLGA